MQKQPGGEKLVAFTRILHRQKGDVLMGEVRLLVCQLQDLCNDVISRPLCSRGKQSFAQCAPQGVTVLPSGLVEPVGSVGWLQVPTWRANPLTPECDTWCEFPVADRPNAVQQWVNAAKADPSMLQVGAPLRSAPPAHAVLRDQSSGSTPQRRTRR